MKNEVYICCQGLSKVWKNNCFYRDVYNNNFYNFYSYYKNQAWLNMRRGVKPLLWFNSDFTDFGNEYDNDKQQHMSDDERQLIRRSIKRSLMTNEERFNERLKCEEFNKYWSRMKNEKLIDL